jgi:hypothetical protein
MVFMQTEIARFLAEKAMRQKRATYQQVGDAVGWNHPSGRGPSNNRETVLHALHDRGRPPLTTISFERGERHSRPEATKELIVRTSGEICCRESAQQRKTRRGSRQTRSPPGTPSIRFLHVAPLSRERAPAAIRAGSDRGVCRFTLETILPQFQKSRNGVT